MSAPAASDDMGVSSAPLRPAVFLDRDGVLNHVVWRDGKPASPRTLEELEVEGDAADALGGLKVDGFALFAVTNQPDIARRRMSRPALETIHDALAAALPLDEIAACIHDDVDRCDCRKPRPGLLLDLARRHRIDLARSWMIGDQDRDIVCGRAAGCATILISKSYNSRAGADFLVDSLWQGVCTIRLKGAARGRACSR